MKTTLVSLAVALALGTLAGCDRNPTPASKSATTPPAASTTPPASSTAGTGSSAAQSNTPSTPANLGTPGQAEKQPPVQGREDVRQPEQRKDFQQKGDGAGPKPGG